jgi:hypothetical protein
MRDASAVMPQQVSSSFQHQASPLLLRLGLTAVNARVQQLWTGTVLN